MGNNILISKKHGVNPTIPVCFFCGKEKNEIVLLGKLTNKKGEEVKAPRNLVMDYEPCENCRKNMALGVTLIGVQEEPIKVNNQVIKPIYKEGDKDLYPTGNWLVITKDASKRYFGDTFTEEELENKDKIFVDQSFINILVKQMEEIENDGI